MICVGPPVRFGMKGAQSGRHEARTGRSPIRLAAGISAPRRPHVDQCLLRRTGRGHELTGSCLDVRLGHACNLHLQMDAGRVANDSRQPEDLRMMAGIVASGAAMMPSPPPAPYAVVAASPGGPSPIVQSPSARTPCMRWISTLSDAVSAGAGPLREWMGSDACPHRRPAVLIETVGESAVPASSTAGAGKADLAGAKASPLV